MKRTLLAIALALPLTSQAQAPAGLTQNLAALADQPATHTGFVFDRSMLQMAQSLLESNGMDARHAAAAIHSVSVDSYHYQQPAFYTPETMSALIANYSAAGWKHLVNANAGPNAGPNAGRNAGPNAGPNAGSNASPGNSAQPRIPITDLWLHFSGADIDGVTVLTRASRDMNVIQLSCDLRPLDLLHLSGHFGIPRVDPNAVMVPAPPGR